MKVAQEAAVSGLTYEQFLLVLTEHEVRQRVGYDRFEG
jgi:hypothetical protein